jgi:hypothetical protein
MGVLVHMGAILTKDDIIKMAIEARLPHYWESGDEIVYIDRVTHFAKLVAQHEREACAKVVEASPSYDWHKFACEAAYAIRARGQA